MDAVFTAGKFKGRWFSDVAGHPVFPELPQEVRIQPRQPERRQFNQSLLTYEMRFSQRPTSHLGGFLQGKILKAQTPAYRFWDLKKKELKTSGLKLKVRRSNLAFLYGPALTHTAPRGVVESLSSASLTT